MLRTICFQMATLGVHEAMGMKVDREAVATLVLPQLWAMSMGPRMSLCSLNLCHNSPTYTLVLSISQFKRFMDVIRKLGDRVEKEHDQYLRDSQRIEDRSSTPVHGLTTPSAHNPLDFENLVGGTNGAAAIKADTVIDSSQGWDDDVWGSIFSSAEVHYDIYFACLRVADGFCSLRPWQVHLLARAPPQSWPHSSFKRSHFHRRRRPQTLLSASRRDPR